MPADWQVRAFRHPIERPEQRRQHRASHIALVGPDVLKVGPVVASRAFSLGSLGRRKSYEGRRQASSSDEMRSAQSGTSTSSAQALIKPKKVASRRLGTSQYNPPPACASNVAPATAKHA